jgi:hypothetical protein
MGIAKLCAAVDQTVLVIEESPDGLFLYYYYPDGFIADTWHPNIEEAKEQAAYAYGSAMSDWVTIPENTNDPVVFARKIFKL